MFFWVGDPLLWHRKVWLTNPGVFSVGGPFDLACESVVNKSWCFFWVGDPLIWHAKVWLTNPGVFLGGGSFALASIVWLTNPGVFLVVAPFDLACESVVNKSWCFFLVG